ncbi:hypothetical protein QQF64_025767 [Cirrhinus molitorella]|uniref:Uncharacterized protein n=1 Tax=Cirrhinus molitorella TaxID=172907 RepID=A0ABR3NQ95_9TELE
MEHSCSLSIHSSPAAEESCPRFCPPPHHCHPSTSRKRDDTKAGFIPETGTHLSVTQLHRFIKRWVESERDRERRGQQGSRTPRLY